MAESAQESVSFLRHPLIDDELARYGGEAYDYIQTTTPGIGSELQRCIGQFGCAMSLVVRAALEKDELTADLGRTRLVQIAREAFMLAGLELNTSAPHKL